MTESQEGTGAKEASTTTKTSKSTFRVQPDGALAKLDADGAVAKIQGGYGGEPQPAILARRPFHTAELVLDAFHHLRVQPGTYLANNFIEPCLISQDDRHLHVLVRSSMFFSSSHILLFKGRRFEPVANSRIFSSFRYYNETTL